MASEYGQILAAGVATLPFSYTVPSTVQIVPLVVNANFNGAAASGSWTPTLEIVSDGGVVIARVPVQTTLATGATCEVTWAPFLRAGGASFATQGGGGLGGPGTYTVTVPTGANQMIVDAVGGGGGAALATGGGDGAGNGSSGGGGAAYQHLEVPTATVASPLTVIVGAGGSGGVPFTHPSGTDGASSMVTDANGVVWVTAAGGKGSLVGGGGGTGGIAQSGGLLTGVGGGVGGSGGTAGAAGSAAAARDGGAPSGGGGGGGTSGRNLGVGSGAAGGNLTMGGVTVVTGGAAGIAAGAFGGSAPHLTNGFAGAGGGGGAGSSADGAPGGGGGLGYYGGGGGGGGAGNRGGGGGGSDGGPGFVRILFS